MKWIDVATVLHAALLSVSAVAQDRPMNVVLIVVDDLGYADLSCTVLADDVKTPNLDKLASQGIRFTQAYATAPICNASRISLMTGSYHQRQGMKWYSGPGLHDANYITIAEILKAKGYATGYIGKFHHGASDGPKGRGFPLNHGFDRLYGFSGGTKHYLHHKKEYGATKLHEGPMWSQNEKVDVEGFATELFGQQARHFIKEHGRKPFFLTLSFNAVHNFTHQLPETYLKEQGLKGFPDIKAGEDYWAWRERISYPNHPEGRAYYLGQLRLLDQEIGRVIKQIESEELKDRTAIILVSDNGGSLVTYANNGPLKGGKYSLFEGGVRVPMIMCVPGMAGKGTVSNAVISTLDIQPTICGLIGAQAPKTADGKDLAASLRSGKTWPDGRMLFWDTGHQESIRSGKWKLLVTYRDPSSRLQIVDTPKGEFLYDLDKDPGEIHNLAEEQPELVKELKSQLKRWKQEVAKKP